jgi:hypothetical protein
MGVLFHLFESWLVKHTVVKERNESEKAYMSVVDIYVVYI